MRAWVCVAFICACSRNDANVVPPARDAASAPQHHDEEEAHEGLPDRVRLPANVAAAAGIETAAAEVDALPVTVDLSGEVAVDPDRSARLGARVQGRVLSVNGKEGQRVKAGQIIATLESSELARARAAFASSSARAKVARVNATRLRALEAKALASGQEAAAAEADADALDAEAAAAKQTLGAFGLGPQEAPGARLTIRTPLAGFILSRDAVQGQTVEAGHIIAVVGDLDRAYFLARLFEKDLALVTVGARAEVRLNAYPDEVFEGEVETIGRQLDPAARTVTARILVRNHGDLLKVGLFGSARVVAGSARTARPKRVVVPLSALTRIADKDVVFVLQPDGHFEVHPVTRGATAAGRVEVLSGLREGERVVVAGVFSLKSAVLKSTFGEDE